MHTIYLADYPESTWPAPTLGPTWNTWATPHVTRDTLTRILTDTILTNGDRYPALHIDPNGHVQLLEATGTDGDHTTTLTPDADGLYDLGLLGWTFLVTDPS